jgi:tetratricopeptide (TPR) repeat protein
MNRDTLLFGLAGVFFGILVGWIIGSQQMSGSRPATPVQASTAAPQSQAAAPALDESRVAALKAAADRNPSDADTRVQLANLYFDSERYEDAAHWYEEALKVRPRDVDASTDLGISYYYMNQPDRALAQFDRSLTIDPKHAKTLLNIGIVRAFGKQDLEGAAKAWEQVVQIAPPDSQEAKLARQALDGIRTGHGNTGGGSPKPQGPSD